MPFFTFETILQTGKPVHRYERWQGMKTPPLERHPETGEPLRCTYRAGLHDLVCPHDIIHAAVEARLAEVALQVLVPASLVVEFPGR